MGESTEKNTSGMKRFSIDLKGDLREKFEEYRYVRRVSQNQAACELIKAGLSALEEKGETGFIYRLAGKRRPTGDEPSARGKNFAKQFDTLNPDFQQSLEINLAAMLIAQEHDSDSQE